jgi:hypothetical protein
MQIFTSEQPLAWGNLDLPMIGLTNDWFGDKHEPPSTFTLAKDSNFLWFISIFPKSSIIHPMASPGQFTHELWKYDVAELFLTNPETGEYLEFNLTSNSAWWASKFSSIRLPSDKQPRFTENILTHHDKSQADYYVSGLQIPIIFLQKEIDFGFITRGNITIIRNSPNQLFLSASKLPGLQPDFHQPNSFKNLSFIPLQFIKN